MSPVVIALLARALVLLAVVMVGREAGRFLMRGAMVAVLPGLPGAADAERVVESYGLGAAALAIFLGVVAAQIWLRLRRARAADRATLWLGIATAVVAALLPSGVLWMRAGADVTGYPELTRGVSVALAGFLPPVAALAAAAWWWVATMLPLPRAVRSSNRE